MFEPAENMCKKVDNHRLTSREKGRVRGSYGTEEELGSREEKRLQMRNGGGGQGAESRRRLPPQFSGYHGNLCSGCPYLSPWDNDTTGREGVGSCKKGQKARVRPLKEHVQAPGLPPSPESPFAQASVRQQGKEQDSSGGILGVQGGGISLHSFQVFLIMVPGVFWPCWGLTEVWLLHPPCHFPHRE